MLYMLCFSGAKKRLILVHLIFNGENGMPVCPNEKHKTKIILKIRK